MKKIFSIFSFILVLSILTSCGGKGKVEVLSDPEIDATINVERGHYWNMAEVAVSPDGKYIASSAYDQRLIIWDAETQHQVMDFQPADSEFRGNYLSLLYTSDGKKLIAGASMYFVEVFDMENGTSIKTIPVDYYSGNQLALSADDKFIAVETKDNDIAMIDIDAGSVVKTFEGHTGSINSIAFSPDGKYMISGSYDSTVIVWDVEKGEAIKKIDAKEEVEGVAFNDASDKFAYSVPDLKVVKVMDIKMKELKTFEDMSVDDLFFEGEDLIVEEYSKIKQLNIETGEVVKEIEDYGWDMSKAGNVLVTAGSLGIYLYDFASGEEIAQFGHDTRAVSNIEVSPSGRFIVTANSHKSGSGGPDILSYAIDTSYDFSAYGTSGGDVGLFAFKGKEDVIFSEKLYGEAYYYDLKTGKSLSMIEDKVTNPLDITSDGTLIVAQDKENSDSYGIYDAKTGDLKKELVSNDGYLYFAGISPDDKYYVLLTMDFCKVFELPSGNEVKSYDREDMDNIVFFDMTADGKYVVGQGDGYDGFKLTDVMTGEVLFLVEDVEVEDAALNADKNTVALACSDWTIKVFDIAQNTQTQTLNGHTASVRSVAYTTDGKYLLSSAEDNIMNIWDLSGKLLLTVVGLENLGDYEGETKDFVVFAPNGRYDGTQTGIDKFLYFDKNGERLPASKYKDKCYTPNLLGRTLGQNFAE